jgi:hypothetical protein
LQLHKENYLNWNEKAHGTDWERAANIAAPALMMNVDWKILSYFIQWHFSFIRNGRQRGR